MMRGLNLKALCILVALLALTQQSFGLETSKYRRGRNLKQSTAASAGEGTCTGSTSYANAVSSFPYALDYTKTEDLTSTNFVFLLCSKPCESGTDICSKTTITSFNLRLSDGNLANAELDVVPAGAANTACTGLGPGYSWGDSTLGQLATLPADKATLCATYNIKLAGSELDLPALCQQDIVVTSDTGASIFNQAIASPGSCVYQIQLSDGKTAYGALAPKFTTIEPAVIPPPIPLVVDDGPLTTSDGNSGSETDNGSSGSGTDYSSGSGSDGSASGSSGAGAGGSPKPYGPTPYGARSRFARQLKNRQTSKLF